MPKQVLKIEQFHGGLSTNSDPRDVAVNELTAATDVMVDELGKIRTLGGTTAHKSNINAITGWTGTLVPGYGLFPFSHDRLEAESAGLDAAETGDNYLALYDDNDQQVWVYSEAVDDGGATGWDDDVSTSASGVIDIGSTGSAKVNFYQADGALRISDGNFGTNNRNKWYGYVDRSKFFSTASGPKLYTDNGWFSLNQAPSKPTGGSFAISDPGYPGTGGTANFLITRVTDGEGSGWGGYSYDFAYSFVYDGNQESPLFISAASVDFSGWDADDHPKIRCKLDTTQAEWNARITQIKVYTRKVVYETEQREWTLYGLYDMHKGAFYGGLLGEVAFPGYSGWTGVALNTQAQSGDLHVKDVSDMIETYRIETGHGDTDNFIAFGNSEGFKTSVVVNRICYIGNVNIENDEGLKEVYGDVILKSDVGKFDIFTFERRLEVSVRDGDEIVKLEEYADRILEFKKNKMSLINISQELEFLEDTFVHKGVSHPAAVCKTDFGIAWVNKLGCYLYDGQKVTNLLEKGGRQIIKESEWATFTANEPMIGYIPKKRQLIVVDDITTNGDGSIFLYDMVTQSWVKGAAGTFNDQNKTNLITDWDGELVYSHTSGTMLQWDDSSDSSRDISLMTKDIDFGQPAIRKKVYRVYLTFRGDACNVDVHYGVDGLTPALTFNNITSGTDGSTTGSGSNDKCIPYDAGTTDWLKAELKPSASVNNISSFRLKISGDGSDAIASDFEINDISIVYRLKNIK